MKENKRDKKDMRGTENKQQNADINHRSLPEKAPGPCKMPALVQLAEIPFQVAVFVFLDSGLSRSEPFIQSRGEAL